MNRIALVLTIMLLLLPTAQAANIETSGSCALADAIIAANNDRAEGDCPAGRGADTIILTQDITLRAELPAITSKITIEGNGYTISGNNRYRIFYNDGGALTIHNLTITNGYVEGDLIRNANRSLKNTTANPIGGAIVNWEGTLTISNSAFSDNLAEEDGGAIYNRGGELSISNSVFSDNLADDEGGAIYNAGGELSISDSAFNRNSAEQSGAIYNWWGTVTISDSAFSSNLANAFGGHGGAIRSHVGELSIISSSFSDNSADEGGAIYNTGELSIINSAFSHNSADISGGAIDNAGELSIISSAFSHNYSVFGSAGAIYNVEELSIVNSAFSGNSANEEGGAIRNRDGLRISSSTFSGNSANEAGGTIYNEDNGKLRMTNSIIAGVVGACHSESRLRHNINNLIADGSCFAVLSGDPMLGELVEPEDGSPAYYPLLEGSPAIDAADNEYCPDTDMLGTARPQGAACDIGAYERPQ